MLSISLFSTTYSNTVQFGRDLTILLGRSAMISLISSGLFTFLVYLIKSLATSVGLFNSVLILNNLTIVFQFFIFLLTTFILGLNSFYVRKVLKNNFSLSYSSYIKNKILNIRGLQFRIIEYPLIIIFVLIGGSLLMCTGDLICIFLSIELQSYGLYILCALYRDSELATKGGLMYFLLGGLSSCFILLGCSILYSNSGVTNLDNLSVVSNLTSISSKISITYLSYFFSLSLLVISVGFLFKISAAPFHFWSPDVYDMIPTIVTTFVAVISKISLLIFLFELICYTKDISFWTNGILISSLLSLIIGTVLGLTQSRIKKIYAYSSISHIGFILLCLNIFDIISIKAFIFYLLSYSISNLNGFLILLCMGFFLYSYIDDNKDYQLLPDYNNSPIQLISQIKGYFYINPAISLSLAVTLFSFIGIPPLIGFFAKQMVLNAALEKGYVFMSIIAIITSVISAVYYLKIINQIFFKKSNYKLNKYIFSNNITNITLSTFITTFISLFTLSLSLFFFFSDECENFVVINSVVRFKTC